jgi:hypothetical protein
MLGYRPPLREGKKSPCEVVGAPEETVPKPNAASNCWPWAGLSKKQKTKRAAIKVSFFNVFSEDWIWIKIWI